MNKMHDAARLFAAKGLAVLPCRAGEKVPATRHGCKDATTDVKIIDSWWRVLPDANIGIATGQISGIFVVDIDGDEGEAGLRKLEAEHGALPETVEAITARGRHIYFRLGDHGAIENSASRIGIGIDIRGEGGYVIAPPSIHPSGKVYAWSVDSTEDFSIAPDWLFTLICSDTTGKPLEHWHDVLTQQIANGQRNSTLASICGKLFFHDVNAILIHDILCCVNEARCETPLSTAEVETIVVSIGKAHLQGHAT